jgi:hypothetical protein
MVRNIDSPDKRYPFVNDDHFLVIAMQHKPPHETGGSRSFDRYAPAGEISQQGLGMRMFITDSVQAMQQERVNIINDNIRVAIDHQPHVYALGSFADQSVGKGLPAGIALIRHELGIETLMAVAD